MVCGYSHCLHKGEEVNKEDGVKIGTRYYHMDCARQRNEKEEVRKIYLEEVNPTEVMKLLNSVINNIVHVKNVESSLLLYALKYAVSNKFKINNPYGLHYLVGNKKIKESYVNREPIKKLYGINVLLTDEEYELLLKEMSEKKLINYIDRLDNYIESTGKRYSSHYHTILLWYEKDMEKKPQVGNGLVIHSS
jgi:hypothetical protein